MNRTLPAILCFLFACLALVGTSPPVYVEANPLEPQRTPVILLTPQNRSQSLEEPILAVPLNPENESGIPPRCSLILHEANLDNVRFTLRIVGTALHWQNENIETWLTVDDQASVKLDRTVLHIGTAALVGGIFTSEYNSTLSGLSEGCHTIEIRIVSLQTCWEGNVSDYYGTSKLEYFVGNVLLRIDTTAPTIANISIVNSIYFSNSLELNCTMDEPISWVAYCLDNQANVTFTNSHVEFLDDNKTIQFSTVLTNLTEGSHSFTVYVKDTAGNTGVSQTITFTVVKIEFSILITAVLIGAVAIVALLVYRRHRKLNPLEN